MEGPGAIPKHGSAHPTPHTRKRHRHDANVAENFGRPLLFRLAAAELSGMGNEA